MPQSKLLKVLQDTGLEEKESRVYLAALTLGPASILKLAEEAEVKRTTIYTLIESLRLKGLITVEMRGFKRRYVASPPSALRSLIASKLATLDESISEFAALFNMSGGGSIIRQYQGLNATKGLYEELLQAVRPFDPYYVLTDLQRWETLDPKFFAGFVKRRARKNVRLRILSTPSKSTMRRQAQDREYGGQVRVLPATMTVTTNMVITPQYLVFHQLVPPMDAILLNNRSIMHLQMEMFNALWESCVS